MDCKTRTTNHIQELMCEINNVKLSTVPQDVWHRTYRLDEKNPLEAS